MEKVFLLIDKLGEARKKGLGTEFLLIIAELLVAELKAIKKPAVNSSVSVIMPNTGYANTDIHHLPNEDYKKLSEFLFTAQETHPTNNTEYTPTPPLLPTEVSQPQQTTTFSEPDVEIKESKVLEQPLSTYTFEMIPEPSYSFTEKIHTFTHPLEVNHDEFGKKEDLISSKKEEDTFLNKLEFQPDGGDLREDTGSLFEHSYGKEQIMEEITTTSAIKRDSYFAEEEISNPVETNTSTESSNIYDLLKELTAFDFSKKEERETFKAETVQPESTNNYSEEFIKSTDSFTENTPAPSPESPIIDNSYFEGGSEQNNSNPSFSNDMSQSFSTFTETPWETTQHSALTIEEKINEIVPSNGMSINDTYKKIEEEVIGLQQQKEQHTEEIKTEKLNFQATAIDDLRRAITINDRYLFINELFKGDEVLYEKCIRTIQHFSNLHEAEFWINKELKPKLKWKENSQSVQLFESFVNRRFS